MALELHSVPDLRIVFKPGATIDRLTETLFGSDTFSPSLWHEVRVVWILVGTNDIGNGLSSDAGFRIGRFLDAYRHLLLSIKAHKRSINVFCCSVLPRLVDYEDSKPVVNSVNKNLRKLCVAMEATFCSIDRAFCYQGVPQEAYYKFDRLHLSRKGVLVVKKCIQQVIAKYRKDPAGPVST